MKQVYYELADGQASPYRAWVCRRKNTAFTSLPLSLQNIVVTQK